MLHFFSDALAGTASYGYYIADANAIPSFSIPFAEYINADLELLFTNGDESTWLVTTYDEVAGSNYDAQSRLVLQSSMSPTPCLCHTCHLRIGYEYELA